MADQEEKAQPTVAGLEAKVQRLNTQVADDGKLAEKANAQFASAVKSGNVDQALELADARGKAQSALAKSQGQVKTATNAVASAKHAQNADKIAAIHDNLKISRDIQTQFEALEKFGVTRVVVERSEETGKLLINSAGPTVKRTRAPGGGGGNGRGQPVVVDGKEFTSASAALHEFFPDSGPLNRDSILNKLTNAGHEVS